MFVCLRVEFRGSVGARMADTPLPEASEVGISRPVERLPSLVPIDDIRESELFSLPPPRNFVSSPPEEEEESHAGKTLARGYVIQQLLAKDTTSSLYLVTQTPPGREVANHGRDV